jgi:para-nitrobenzyl esterase
MRHLSILLLIVMLSSFSSLPLKKDNSLLTVKEVVTESGIISGISGIDSVVKIFKGVPFAAPPVGNLRWKPPVKASSWTGIRKCDEFAASAIQNPPVPFAMWTKEFMAPVAPISEDCLYLNVWTAARFAAEKRPVIVWIHGGAFTGGSGSVPLYDGETMAKKGVVFITINYRLGIFGFLAHPELSAESDKKVSGNYGILDQIAALEWVKRNVAAFGGDPGKVTIAGQSAGAFSVNALMVSPLAKGLFHRAIAQSGGMLSGNLVRNQPLADAEKLGEKIAAQVNAKSIKELRMKPAEELLKAGGRWSITTDGIVVPHAYSTYAAGKQNDVPLLTGWNGDDGVSFGEPPTAKSFIANAQNQYKEKAAAFLKVFPATTDEEAKTTAKLASQLSFGFLNYRWALMQSKTGKNKAYLYYFTRVPPGEPNYGAFHSAEFGYALGILALWNRPWQPWDHQLSDMMTSYWVNFATTGNPNSAGLPLWPEFNGENPQVILFGDKVNAEKLPYQQQLEVLDLLN